MFLSLAWDSFLTCLDQFSPKAQVGTLSRYLGFFVSETLLACSLPCNSWRLDSQLRFLNLGRLGLLESPFPAAWPGNCPCSIWAVVGLTSLASCLLWSLRAMAQFTVLSAIRSYSLSIVLIVPGRKVNLVSVPPPWMEAEVSPHCGFNFPFVITGEIKHLFTCFLTTCSSQPVFFH